MSDNGILGKDIMDGDKQIEDSIHSKDIEFY